MKLTREMAIVLGLLYTDGCVSRKGKGSWRIYFSSRSPGLVDCFRTCIIAAFGSEHTRVRMGSTSDGLAKAVVDSATIGDWLTRTFGTFRTLRFDGRVVTSATLPVAPLLRSGHTADFLRAAFSGDGGVSLYPARRAGSQGGTRWLIRTIFLACTHPRLRAQYQVLLAELGIASRDVARDGRLKIEDEKNIRLFAQRIGFLPGALVTRHSKFWNGREKCAVLDLLLASYRRPRSVYELPQFQLRS